MEGGGRRRYQEESQVMACVTSADNRFSPRMGKGKQVETLEERELIVSSFWTSLRDIQGELSTRQADV